MQATMSTKEIATMIRQMASKLPQPVDLSNMSDADLVANVSEMVRSGKADAIRRNRA